MLIQIARGKGRWIVNTDYIAEVEVTEVDGDPQALIRMNTKVEGPKGPRPRAVRLHGNEARHFLAALPTYSPALEPDELGDEVELEMGQ